MKRSNTFYPWAPAVLGRKELDNRRPDRNLTFCRSDCRIAKKLLVLRRKAYVGNPNPKPNCSNFVLTHNLVFYEQNHLWHEICRHPV